MGLFQGALVLPLVIVWVVIVGGDKDRNILFVGHLKQLLDVLDGTVLGDVLADQAPGHALGAEKVVLRIGDDNGGLAANEGDAGIRQVGLGSPCHRAEYHGGNRQLLSEIKHEFTS